MFVDGNNGAQNCMACSSEHSIQMSTHYSMSCTSIDKANIEEQIKMHS